MVVAERHGKTVQPSVIVVRTMWVVMWAQGEGRTKLGLYFDGWSATPSSLEYYRDSERNNYQISF